MAQAGPHARAAKIAIRSSPRRRRRRVEVAARFSTKGLSGLAIPVLVVRRHAKQFRESGAQSVASRARYSYIRIKWSRCAGAGYSRAGPSRLRFSLAVP